MAGISEIPYGGIEVKDDDDVDDPSSSCQIQMISSGGDFETSAKVKCPDCDGYFNRSSLDNHIRNKHWNEKNYKCQKCEFTTFHKGSMALHERSHTGEKTFECPNCDKLYATKNTLRMHIKTVHLKHTKFSCDKCDYKTNAESAMQWHIAKHNGTKRGNECEKCDIVFENKIIFNNHMVTAHAYKACDLCGKSFVRDINLIKHKEACANRKAKLEIRRANLDPKKYTPEFKIEAVRRVDEIGFAQTYKELNLHDNTLRLWCNLIHKPATCTFCEKEFESNYKLKIHVRSKHADDHGCQSKDGLNGESGEDLLPNTSNQEYQCDQCSKSFTNSRNLKRHLARCSRIQERQLKLIEKKNKVYSCDICGVVQKSQRYLDDHKKRIHENIKEEHPCDICGKTFERRKSLLYHIKCLHEKSKDFVCGFCGKRFLQYSIQKKHERKHTGEKEYQCEVCGESCSKYMAKKSNFFCFHCNIALVKTEFTSEPRPIETAIEKMEEKPQCNLCLNFFARKDNLKVHQRKCSGIRERNSEKENKLKVLYNQMYEKSEKDLSNNLKEGLIKEELEEVEDDTGNLNEDVEEPTLDLGPFIKTEIDEF